MSVLFITISNNSILDSVSEDCTWRECAFCTNATKFNYIICICFMLLIIVMLQIFNRAITCNICNRIGFNRTLICNMLTSTLVLNNKAFICSFRCHYNLGRYRHLISCKLFVIYNITILIITPLINFYNHWTN